MTNPALSVARLAELRRLADACLRATTEPRWFPSPAAVVSCIADVPEDAEFIAACDPSTVSALVALAERGAEDSARLDWLDERREALEASRTVGRQIGEDEWEPVEERELLGYRWDGIEGQCETVRDAIDAARPTASPTPPVPGAPGATTPTLCADCRHPNHGAECGGKLWSPVRGVIPCDCRAAAPSGAPGATTPTDDAFDVRVENYRGQPLGIRGVPAAPSGAPATYDAHELVEAVRVSVDPDDKAALYALGVIASRLAAPGAPAQYVTTLEARLATAGERRLQAEQDVARACIAIAESVADTAGPESTTHRVATQIADAIRALADGAPGAPALAEREEPTNETMARLREAIDLDETASFDDCLAVARELRRLQAERVAAPDPCGAAWQADYGRLPCDRRRGHTEPHRCYGAQGPIEWVESHAALRAAESSRRASPTAPDAEATIRTAAYLMATRMEGASVEDSYHAAYQVLFAHLYPGQASPALAASPPAMSEVNPELLRMPFADEPTTSEREHAQDCARCAIAFGMSAAAAEELAADTHDNLWLRLATVADNVPGYPDLADRITSLIAAARKERDEWQMRALWAEHSAHVRAERLAASPPEAAPDLRARLAALTEVHEFYEFDATTEEQFDTWLHERIKEVREKLGLSARAGGDDA